MPDRPPNERINDDMLEDISGGKWKYTSRKPIDLDKEMERVGNSAGNFIAEVARPLSVTETSVPNVIVSVISNLTRK